MCRSDPSPISKPSTGGLPAAHRRNFRSCRSRKIRRGGRNRRQTPSASFDAIYFAYSDTLMAQMANAVGKPVDAKRYSDLSFRIRDRFREDYVKGDGTLKVETQTAYALALAHGMVSGSEPTVAERLVQRIGDNGYRMTTGFLGTYPLLPVLSESGHHDLAVRLFPMGR